MSGRSTGIAARVIGVLVGVGLMVAPAAIEVGDLASAIARIAGPLQAALCFVALASVVGAVRWASVSVGTALLVSAIIVFDAAASAMLAIAGVAIMLLGLVPLPASSRFGGGWRQAWSDLRAPREGDGDARA